MLTGRPTNFYKLRFFLVVLPVILITSCGVIPKDYPKDKPFVFETTINVNGNFTNEERETLQSGLKGQLDDSMRARSVSKLFYSVMKKPPVYDAANADRSVLFMRALLISLGYFKDSITYDTTIIKKDDQYRTTVTFNVTPGKVVKLDSISYNIKQQELQAITIANKNESLLKKGNPFAKSTISMELDRLVDLYRNSGYLRFNREELRGIWDTLDIELLRPTFDPVEQLAILQKLKERRENPTANLEIVLRPGFDSSKLIKYFVGNVSIYPEFSPDTAGLQGKEEMVNGVKVISFRNTFKAKILPQNVYFQHGDLYNQRKYYKTINRFNSLGAWRLVNIEQIPRKNQDTADFVIRLTPAKKYSFNANLEGSRNQSVVSGNLFGIGVNTTVLNRNFARRAIQSNTSIRYGIELSDSSFIQTQQFAISHNIYFPRPIPNSNWIPDKWRDNFRTVLSFNAANTERKDLFNLTTINGSWGYNFQVKNALLSFRYPNIEYSYIKRRQKLNELIANNPLLKNIFTDGLIESMSAGVSITGGKNENVNTFRGGVEISGLLTRLFNSDFLDTNLFRFAKIDLEFVRKIQFKKTALALRLFAGAGYAFESTVNENKRYGLPLFRQYFAGGPNSMRAWALRKLGPGSFVKDFSNTSTGLPERYGDMQLEANIEYRFPWFKIAGVQINGALFTDIGNIWFLKKADGREPEERFNLGRLGKDLAVGVGTGLRVDFTFFVIRLDYSYKAKDPSPADIDAQNKWFYRYQLKSLLKGQLQLGINYPFVL